jgi:hypothetical protein
MINSPQKEYLLRDVLGEVGIVPGVSSLDGVRIWDGGGTVRVRVKKDDLAIVRERISRLLAGKEGLEGISVDVIRA